jgi:hypothetical protein
MLTYKQIISIKGYLHFTFHGERQQEADALCDMALRCEKAEARLEKAEALLKHLLDGNCFFDQTQEAVLKYFSAKEANDAD